MKINQRSGNKRKESKIEVQTFLERLKYAISSGNVTLNLIKDRKIDYERNKKNTNRYTIGQLFPDEDEIEAIKRELVLLTVEEYIETVKDERFSNRSDMRVFGREYSGNDVYIKIRVELISIAHASGDSFIMVMSFHYSHWDFKERDFPYRKV